MIGWLDCGAGASGDMLLGALVDAGVPVSVMQNAVDALGTGPIQLTVSRTQRHQLAATKVDISAGESPIQHRTWRDIRALLAAAPLSPAVRDMATATFERLAVAEGNIHGVDATDVHFHEVGALDSIADIVGVCAGFVQLGLSEIHCGSVNLGGGQTHSAHGPIPVPAPATLAVLAAISAPVHLGADNVELCTPTGAALLATWVTHWGSAPQLAVTKTGTGAGSRELPSRANILRLVLGDPSSVTEPPLMIETNIDDMDPRLWPHVIAQLLAAGASDAWLTPILMKKGRPAHTLHVLASDEAAPTVRAAIFDQTTTIGVREYPINKHALRRAAETVFVDGQEIRVKNAYRRSADAGLANTSVEYEDVVAAAAVLGIPAKTVLARATAAATEQEPGPACNAPAAEIRSTSTDAQATGLTSRPTRATPTATDRTPRDEGNQ